MKRFAQTFSVKARMLASILGALFLFVAGYTLFWSDRYSKQLNAEFEAQLALAPTFLATPLVGAIWDFQPDKAQEALQGLTAMDPFTFARVVESNSAFAQLSANDVWPDQWDQAISGFDMTSQSPQRASFGSDVLVTTPLMRPNGDLVGQLVLGFSRQGIEAATKSVWTLAGVIGAVVFALFAVLAVFIAESVTQPLKNVIGLIDRMRQGETDFEAEIALRGDEFGNLGRAVEEFRDNLIEKQRLEREEAESKREQEALEEKLAIDARIHEETVEKEKAKRLKQKADGEARKAEAEAEQAAEREARAVDQQAVVTALAEGLGALSQGNLGYRIVDAFAAGYEKLRTDFNDAMDGLQSSMSAISNSGQQITRNTSEISASAADLARRTEITAATLEETAAALDGITGSVRQSAEGARRADSVVKDIQANSEASGTVVAQAVQNMAGIKESSDKIAKVIGVIDGVAFQTNLLALNAGVEAARAGDAGRGFAVVATEVRELSQRTAEAAREVGELIRISSEQVDQGVQSVGETGVALEGILNSILEISGFVGDIATSAEDQSNSIAEINSAITQLDSATQQNAAMFEETTAASQSLNCEAMALSEAISHFQVDENLMETSGITRRQVA